MRIILICAVLLCSSVFSAEVQKDEKTLSLKIFVTIAQHYLETEATAAENADWQTKWTAKVKQAQKDNENLDEGMYLNDFVLVWAQGRSDLKIDEVTKEDKLTACRLLMKYIDGNFALPDFVVKELSIENTQIALEVIKSLLHADKAKKRVQAQDFGIDRQTIIGENGKPVLCEFIYTNAARTEYRIRYTSASGSHVG